MSEVGLPATPGRRPAFPMLVSAARASSWEGPAADDLLSKVLPPLVNRLAARFPELDRGDIFNRVLILLDGKLPEGGVSLAWVRKCLERELLNAVRGQRELRCEDKARRINFTAERDALAVHGDGALVIRGSAAEKYLEAVAAAPDRSEVGVWEELRRLLVSMGWPLDIADRAVAVLETRAECRMVSIPATAKDLKFLPKGYRTPLARFAFAKPGFVWARLHRITLGTALAMVQEDLEGLVWTANATGKKTAADKAA